MGISSDSSVLVDAERGTADSNRSGVFPLLRAAGPAVAAIAALGAALPAGAAITQYQDPWYCSGTGYSCNAFDYKHDTSVNPGGGGHRWMSPFIYIGCNKHFDRFNPKMKYHGNADQYYQDINGNNAWVKYATTPNATVTVTPSDCIASGSAPAGDVGFGYLSPDDKKTGGDHPLRVRTSVTQYCNGDPACGTAQQTYTTFNVLAGV